MKKACNVLLLVGTIVSIVLAVVSFLTAISFLFILSNFDRMAHQSTPSGYNEEVIYYLFMGYTIFFFALAISSILNAVFANASRNCPTRNTYILNIVFGALSIPVTIVAGIFGIILLNREENSRTVE